MKPALDQGTVVVNGETRDARIFADGEVRYELMAGKWAPAPPEVAATFRAAPGVAS